MAPPDPTRWRILFRYSPAVGDRTSLVLRYRSEGAASAGGVFCDVSGFVAANNVVFRNTGGSSGTSQTFGNCTYGNSFRAAGSGATDNTPMFASPNAQPYDYFLGWNAKDWYMTP